MTDRDRSKWAHWMTRIPEESGDRLLNLAQLLEYKHLIPKRDRYNITRYALLKLERELYQEYQRRREAMAHNAPK